MYKKAASLAVFGAVLAMGSQAAFADPDWGKVPKREIHVFHPGTTPIEWATKKADHSGSAGIKKGEACAGCHEEKGALSLDFKRLAKELEPKGAPKTMTFPVTAQAAYDANNLYVRLTFKAPAGAADPQDKDNDVKVAMMFANDKVPLGDQVGCWATCHTDARTMPGADDHKTKYVKDGAYDLMQWKSAKGAKAADGTITDKRAMEGGKAGVKADGSKSGDTYTVTFTRKLAGGVTMAEGKAIPFGIAIHSDHAVGRFHHVSFGYKLGIGADGDLKAAKL